MSFKGKANLSYRNHNKVRFYYGIVTEVDTNYVIRFRIPEILDNLEVYPTAHPITRHTSEVKVDDNVLIMQLDTDIQDYVYFSNDTTEFTGIEFGNASIDISDGESVKIEVKEKASIVIDDNGIEIKDNRVTGGSIVVKDRIKIENTTQSLKKLIDDLFTQLMSLKTIGSPAAHVLDPSSLGNLIKLQGQFGALLE